MLPLRIVLPPAAMPLLIGFSDHLQRPALFSQSGLPLPV
jgi:hypothetical protein